MNLFEHLKNTTQNAWQGYIRHPFVQQLEQGTLPKQAFQFYLKQDYLFLLNFGRAWALAAFKADTLDQLRGASHTLDVIINTEIKLHVQYCKDWGISEKEAQQVAEHPSNVAYTRFALDCGQRGDLLNLYAAMSPCVMGYGEIGKQLEKSKNSNPYQSWIEMYASDDFQSLCTHHAQGMQVIAEQKGVTSPQDPRFAQLAEQFETSTIMEQAFWQMGLDQLT